MSITAADAQAFLAAHMPELHPWQERLAVSLLGDDLPRVMLAGSYRSGRETWLRARQNAPQDVPGGRTGEAGS